MAADIDSLLGPNLKFVGVWDLYLSQTLPFFPLWSLEQYKMLTA